MDIYALIATFGSIILLDLVLSGDNAVIVGTLAASLPPEQRNKAIVAGTVMAVVFRIVLSLLAAYLLLIPGLRFIGGLTLIWVAYGMWKDLRDNDSFDGSEASGFQKRTFASALTAIAIADLTMSVDNILAVAGAANGHWGALIFGLLLSIIMMALCAKVIAGLIDRWKWIAWFGLVMVIGVAGKLIYEDVPTILGLFH